MCYGLLRGLDHDPDEGLLVFVEWEDRSTGVLAVDDCDPIRAVPY